MRKNMAVLFNRKNGKICTETTEAKIKVVEGMAVKMNQREIDVCSFIMYICFFICLRVISCACLCTLL